MLLCGCGWFVVGVVDFVVCVGALGLGVLGRYVRDTLLWGVVIG
jgi:hypothetical protein